MNFFLKILHIFRLFFEDFFFEKRNRVATFGFSMSGMNLNITV